MSEPDSKPLYINLAPMDWTLFQQQRLTLLDLLQGEHDISDEAIDHLQGLLHLTDTIVDSAKALRHKIPALDKVEATNG